MAIEAAQNIDARVHYIGRVLERLDYLRQRNVATEARTVFRGDWDSKRVQIRPSSSSLNHYQFEQTGRWVDHAECQQSYYQRFGIGRIVEPERVAHRRLSVRQHQPGFETVQAPATPLLQIDTFPGNMGHEFTDQADLKLPTDLDEIALPNQLLANVSLVNVCTEDRHAFGDICNPGADKWTGGLLESLETTLQNITDWVEEAFRRQLELVQAGSDSPKARETVAASHLIQDMEL